MFTVEEFEEELEYDDDDLDAGELIGNDDKIDDDFEFYLPLVFTYEQKHYTFVNWYDQTHATSAPRKK